MTARKTNDLPIVYSCSGCSNVAQLANRIALELNREEVAEMSCIAGVGGGVKPLVRLAKSGRTIVAIDGCALQCVKCCLARYGIEPNLEFTLTEFGFAKNQGMETVESQVSAAKAQIVREIRN